MRSAGRALIIVENLPVPFDRRVWMEANTLREAGYEVSVICPTGKGFEARREVIDGIHIYRHPLPSELSSAFGYLREYSCALLWEFRLALRVWRKRRFDIIHICNPPDLIFSVALLFKIFGGVRVIYDQHDLNPEMYVAKFGQRGFFHFLLLCAERLSYATADVVIATNESHREVALTRGLKTADRVFIVRSAPDSSRFRPVPPNPTYRRGREHLVGYVGVMGEPEGLDCLLRSVRHIVKEKGRKDVHFMLIGSGPIIEELKTMAKDLDIAEFVEFTGRIPDDELMERLSSCDVCVSPDLKNPYNDRCTMNKVLEYMALGKPVVQFDLLEGRRSAGGASLYAKPNDEVDFAEKILDLLEDSKLRGRLGAEGWRRMEESLEWRHQAPKLLEAYATAFSRE